MTSLGIFIFIAASLFPYSYGDEGSCFSSNSPFPELIKHFEQLDWLGKEWRLPKAKNKSDYISPFGTVISASCFSHGDKTLTDSDKEKFNQAILYALLRTDQCVSLFELNELHSVVPAIRRTRVECGNFEQDSNVTPLQSLLGGGPQTMGEAEELPSTSLDYEARIDTAAHGRFLKSDELGAVIFHELLHQLGADNRSWHNSPEKRMNANLCKNSSLMDRVYYLQSLCFPSIKLGHSLRCAFDADTCISALSDADKAVRIKKAIADLAFIPLTQKDRVLQKCQIIASTERRHQFLKREIKNARNAGVKGLDFLERELISDTDRNADNQKDYEEIQKHTGKIASLFFSAVKTPQNIKAILENMGKEKGFIEELIASRCKTEDNAWKTVCAIKGRPILDPIIQKMSLLESFRDRDRQILDFFGED